MADLGWSSYIAAMEAANWGACIETAKRNGHNREEAEECDNGSVGCPDCPFLPKAEQREERP
jgi:hypothetical protein